MISKEALEYSKLLCEQPLYKIYRAADMGCFDFGRSIFVKNRKGVVKCSSLAIHLQCPFRIISKDENIIFTAYDMYLSHSGERMKGMSWDVYGKNLFDLKSKAWMEANPGLYVTSVNLNQQGDLKILFSNGERLEAFVNHSTEDECWRFFERNSAKAHLVISGIGSSWE
ncbi:MAG: hypothetical protein K2O42_02470 [Oscillospiraceae bacterium]|nr:hypothetical protein [Oscillospiraceae bacterium]